MLPFIWHIEDEPRYRQALQHFTTSSISRPHQFVMPCSGIFSAEKQYNFYQKAEGVLPAWGRFSTGKRYVFYWKTVHAYYRKAAQNLPYSGRFCAAFR